MNTPKPHITEATAEMYCDRRVHARLAVDHAYKYAETMVDADYREEEISRQVWAELEAEYEIS